MRGLLYMLALLVVCTDPVAAQHGSTAASRSTGAGTSRSTTTAPTTPLATAPGTMVPGPTTTPPSTTLTPTSPGTSTTTTSPGTLTSPTTTTTTGTQGGGGASTPNLSAFNPGAQDLNAPTEPNRITSPTGAPGSPTTATGTPTPTTGDQILGTNGVQLPNVGTATTGAIPGQVTTNRGEVNASSGGTARPDPGATGRNMTECMSAWDSKTHITKPRWREICARTLTEPHV
jgi:hypothetical protein